MKQITKKEAIEIYRSKVWQKWSDEEKVKFQLYQRRLCMPFDEFHRAVEKVLGRPVYTHEFAFVEKLREEFEGKREKPTFEEIVSLFPQSSVCVVLPRKEG